MSQLLYPLSFTAASPDQDQDHRSGQWQPGAPGSLSAVPDQRQRGPLQGENRDRRPLGPPIPPACPKPISRLCLRAYVRRAVRQTQRHAPEAHGAGRSDGRRGQGGAPGDPPDPARGRRQLRSDPRVPRAGAGEGGRAVTSLKAVRPGHQLVKIVYDELVALLGEKQAPIAYASVPPTVILLVGLQGSGKTTTAGKLARRLKLEQKAPFLVAADVYRPAAIEQLQHAGRAGRGRRARRPGVARTWSKHRARRHRGGGEGAGAHGHRRHRRPAADRRRDDGRAQAAQGRGQARTRSCWWPTA